MSERPTGSESGPAPASGRPWRRFRDLPIWSKLGLIMIVPTMATIVVGTNGLIGHIDTANSVDRAGSLANLAGISGDLVHHLQQERATAVLLLGADDEEAREEHSSAYAETQRAVDDAEQRFQNQSVALTDIPGNFRDQLAEIRGQISVLPQTRNQITEGTFGLTDSAASYEQLIDSLINMRDNTAQFAGEVELGNRMRAAATVARAKELLSRQRVVGHEVLIRGAYHPHLRSSFIGARTGHEQALQSFAAVATEGDQAMLDQALEGPDVRQSQLYQDYLDSLDSTRLGDPPWDAESWDSVMAAHSDLLRGVEQQLDEVIVADAAALRNAVERRVLLETGALLAMLLIAILLAWLVARSMARSLRDLRQGALAVAQHGLPDAVTRLRDPTLSTKMAPHEVASQLAEPLPVRSRDEFGQVAEAFNAVHLEAVRTAAEQAQLRSSVATMFVNLARRSQILVDRLINHLDRLERGEQDPDRLAELFQLDHLATRMRRNDENLLVLAGADSTRVQREPASLMDVLRAAQSEVEHYTRVEFGAVDREVEIAPHAVNDLVHLVAELLDNATAFSPPESQVMVEARPVGDRAVLYVEDRGLGMSSEQLAEINERLANPPMVDVAVSRMMGLVVVARLAARHGVRVELRHAPDRGTIADVTLPSPVLVSRVASESASVSAPPQGAVAAPAEQPALEPRPEFERQPQAPTPLAQRMPRPAAQPPAPPPSPSFSHPPPPFSPPPYPETTAAATGPDWLGPLTDRPGPPVAPRESAEAGAPEHSAGEQAPTSGAPASAPPATGRGGRSVPAWSDLTGASANNGADRTAAPSATPLPRRTPGGQPSSGQPPQPQAPDLPQIPRPRQEPAPAEPGPTNYREAAPAGNHEPVPSWPSAAPSYPTAEASPAGEPAYPGSHDLTSGAPATSGPPPQWPPVAPSAATPVPTETSSSNMYAGPSGPARADGSAAPSVVRAPVAEETMELPIFRELESAWFRTSPPARPASERQDHSGSRSVPRQPAAGSETVEMATVQAGGQGARTGEAGRRPEAGESATVGSEADFGAATPTATGETMASDRAWEPTTSPPSPDQHPGERGWQTAADDGWRAATDAAQVQVQERTSAGLPKRRPMAQLVPGGVDRAPSGAERRSPEAVRGLLSAYHRGVQRGRAQNTSDESSDSGASQSPPAGKERRT